MSNPLHLALLKLSEKIGQALRETEGELLSYPRALELLGDLEDGISDMANAVTESQEPVDEAYERAASRARSNDFEDTGGKDWT